MRIKRLEILLRDIRLILALLNVVLLEHRVFYQVGIRDVVQDGIAQHFHLLVAGVQGVGFLEAAMCEGLQ